MTDRIVNKYGYLQQVRNNRLQVAPSNEYEDGNPFFKKKPKDIVSVRECKECGKKFTLHVPYDPTNPTHDLCEYCLIPDDDDERPRAIRGDEFMSLQIENSRMEAVGKEFITDGEDVSDD